MTAAAQRDINGRGAYPLRVAAAYAHMPAQTVNRWVKGYDYKHRGERRHSHPISFLAYQGGDVDTTVLDFEQLLTLLLVRAFKTRGLGLPTIKKAAAKAQQVYDLRNPFVSNRFRSDGNKIFIDLGSTGQERQLINVLSDQHEFRRIVEPSLFEDVVFADDHAREWWPLGRDHSVVVSPGRQFGAAYIVGKGTRTDIIAEAVAAERTSETVIADVADWFGLTPDEVRDAVRFEGRWPDQA
jgi:uncharacterized protein (DUF433 family)